MVATLRVLAVPKTVADTRRVADRVEQLDADRPLLVLGSTLARFVDGLVGALAA